VTAFHDFLRQRIAAGGFSTGDVLASFLPLARQVVAAHAAGRVAPLDGVAALHVEGLRLWFHEDQLQAPRHAPAELRRVDRPRGAVEVLTRQDRTLQVDEGRGQATDLSIGARGEAPARPVFLPGWACWEHQLGHHDPVTDVFSLGQVLASLACGLDLAEPDDLASFVAHRHNLFRLRPGLHPVLAKAIVAMTEPSRHARPQELATVVQHLEHYRDQDVDFAFDLASAEAAAAGAGAGAGAGRRAVILGKLRERLFEISRRNRLLHFRPTLHTVNLTHASVPLSFDVEQIQPGQILTWSGPFAAAVSAGEPVSLSRHLDFAEQLYLPGVLDRVRADAARDAAEFGFEQLRLALCFLRWANLKETPAEHYDSPLVLLPVRLMKKKGVRDSYWLQPLGTEAEVNPVVRHLFAQLHGIELPATLDLAETSLDALHEALARRIAESEPGVTLRKVDRPRIDLIRDLAQRRLDRHRRSARLSGRGIRTFLDVDYSYDPANFHPLGLALFRARVKPQATHLKEILQERPAPRAWAAAPAEGQAPPLAEREKHFYSLREQGDDNPYHWDFDLCRVTLGNFKYRKMTLVRDYSALLADEGRHQAFEAVFSLAPRPVEWEAPGAPPPAERWHVVSCDPTQAAAIGLARTGASYIVQGPPGTGKSQTITNLIADYVMRGKRVLFVCEKRAAIDVVFARLRQRGLDPLCCLIHDSQADKRPFIQDLKATYEGLLAEPPARPRAWRDRRAALLEALLRELAPLEAADRALRAVAPEAGVPLREAVERALELQAEAPALSALEQEELPTYQAWVAHRGPLEALAEALADLQPDGVLAHHPLRLLGPAVLAHERPGQLVATGITAALGRLVALRRALAAPDVPERAGATLGDALALGGWAGEAAWLTGRGLGALLDEASASAARFAAAQRALSAARAGLDRAATATANWTDKLPEDEVRTALAQATALEGRWTSVFNPAWWRLRQVLRARYAFSRHAVRPAWTQVLSALAAEQAAARAVAEAERAGRAALGVEEGLDEVATRRERARQAAAALPAHLRQVPAELIRDRTAGGTPGPTATDPAAAVAALVEARPLAEALRETLTGFLAEEALAEPLAGLEPALRGMEAALPSLRGALQVLGLVAGLPPPLATALRSRPLTVRRLEAATVLRCVEEALRGDRALLRFDGALRARHLDRLAELARLWEEANAGAVLERAREGFLEHVRLATRPAAELTREQKDFKATYARGRRTLEHELGKVMRHKSIRDLVAGESGPVIFDLKPVWLMSPLSVSDTLPLRADAFDVVVFDEASQITLESAVPAIFRAPQAIVVGDEMQLPPTDFFSARTTDGDEEALGGEADAPAFEYDLSANSLLSHAATNLPSRMLGWHYRSRSESLIGFSNWAFYQGRLLTVPEEQVAGAEAPAADPGSGQGSGDGGDGDAVTRLLARPLSHHLVADGLYENRRNRAEAAYVARLVRGLLAQPVRRSIGVVAFSVAQQGEIEAALDDLAGEDPVFAERLEAEWEREEDGQLVGLLVKNLENIQGDERDVVILSVCYGRARDGKMRMNFGPINQRGGEKRLNVAFSRAKHHMCVVASIRHGEITNDYNDGAACLKSYLRYAEAASSGEATAAAGVLREVAAGRDLAGPGEGPRGVAARQLAEALSARGYLVVEGVGMSHFRCDLAVRRHGERRHRLGILLDGAGDAGPADLMERDLLRPQLLRAFGWRVAQVLSTDWLRDRRAVLERLVELLEREGDAKDGAAGDDRALAADDDPWAELDAAIEASLATSAPAATAVASPAGAGGAGPEPAAAGPGSPATVPGSSPTAPGTLDGGTPRYLEFVGGASRKYWEVRVDGRTVLVRFGRIGTAGQVQQKVFTDGPTARRTAERLVREKLAKGYVDARPPAG